jgi:hypothetical protein
VTVIESRILKVSAMDFDSLRRRRMGRKNREPTQFDEISYPVNSDILFDVRHTVLLPWQSAELTASGYQAGFVFEALLNDYDRVTRDGQRVCRL